jgi:dipeptidyl aminopeptidase/acylaminoacyl peptidase
MAETPFVWTPELLIQYPSVSQLDLSPDGTQVVYGIAEPVLTEEESKLATHLYRVAVEGGEPIRLTYGTASNVSPRWSPDGRFIAFLSDRKGGKMNLYVMRADGGEPWPLTDAEKGVGSFAWSPDGTRLGLVMAPADSAEKKAAKKAKNDALLWDVDLERNYLWVLPFAPGDAKLPELRPLTGENRHVLTIDWTQDGKALAFIYQPKPGDDYWPQACLAVVEAEPPAEGKAPAIRELAHVASGGPCLVHGAWVACATAEKPVSWTFADRIVLYPLGGGAPRPLALTHEAMLLLLGWSADGQRVYITEPSHTSTALRALPIDGGGPLTLLEGRGAFWCRANARDTFALVAQGADEPNYIAVMRAGEATWREVARLTLPAGWPEDKLPKTEVFRWRSTDGLEIEGLLTYPLGYEPGRPYPTLVVVHGGPMGYFAESYDGAPSLYPMASFAERGYVLLRPNPRGSCAYGAAFRAANKRDWGGGDYRDIMSGVDALVERGIADPQRLGIMGWSYGGYMTSWTITQTKRFRAASVGAGVTNLMSFTGTSDITGFIPDFMEAEYWDDLDAYRQHSPMFNLKGVTTPTLIQHGEADVRVPLGQGRELYNALKRQGVTVEMVIYPRAGHGPNEPRQILDVMRRNLDWFDRWLKEKL